MKSKPLNPFLFASAVLLLGGIGWLLFAPNHNEPYPKIFEVEGSTGQRITKATRILSKYCKPPGPLLDAQLAEDLFDNSGGLVPGPSDSHIYGVLTVPATDLPKWRELLATGSTDGWARATDSRPVSVPTWWPAEESLGTAELFHARLLIGRAIGWAAVSSADSSITFYAFDP